MAQCICLLPMSGGADTCLQSCPAWDPGWIEGCSPAVVHVESLRLQILPHNILKSGGLLQTIAQIGAFIFVGQRTVLRLGLGLVSLQGWCAIMNLVPWFTAAEPGTCSSKMLKKRYSCKPVSSPINFRDSPILKHLATAGLSWNYIRRWKGHFEF